MKVVSKYGLNGPYTVLGESPKYYIVRDAVGHSMALDKQEWEPVQEWVPVYTFEMWGMKDKEIRARHSGNGFITVEVKR